MSEGSNTIACPFCGRPVKATARYCSHCGEAMFEGDEEDTSPRSRGDGGEAALRWLVPIDRSGWAIAAGYLGLLSCFPFIGLPLGITAMICGFKALRQTDRNPRLGGRGRAYFGLVVGVIMTIGNAILIASLVASYLARKH
jgi:hypothetical protein